MIVSDKNAIAMHSGLLGAYLNHIYNFLVVTGDPIPSMTRNTIKSVFNFDSVGLMRIIGELNEDQFSDAPVCFGGAINQSRRNLDIEIDRVKKKEILNATQDFADGYYFSFPFNRVSMLGKILQ